jgi:cytidylate kinase
MSRDIPSILEEQIQRWQSESRAGGSRPRREAGSSCVVAISNNFGSGGTAIAARVGALLGVPVYDRDIVGHIAASAQVSVQTVETLDERARSRIDDYLAAILQEANFDRADYLRHLTRTILALEEHGPCVLVGHGAVDIVDRKRALAVRLVAPEAYRVSSVAARLQITLAEAQQKVQQTDEEREGFHQRLFRRAVNEPLNYDLVLNTSDLGVEGSAAIVAEAYRRKLEQVEARSDAEVRSTATAAS